jgi:hypothetical protein
MARRVFYSFHFDGDFWRTNQIRNIGVVEGNKPVSANEWEEVKKKGNDAIKKWINDHLYGCGCTIVLIGRQTASREWVRYEIEKSWVDGKGVLGIYIHNLKDNDGNQSSKGRNPFAEIALDNGRNLSDYVFDYDPPYSDSKKVYEYISEKLEGWVEKAIAAR